MLPVVVHIHAWFKYASVKYPLLDPKMKNKGLFKGYMLRTMHNEVHDKKEFRRGPPCYDIYVLHRNLYFCTITQVH